MTLGSRLSVIYYGSNRVIRVLQVDSYIDLYRVLTKLLYKMSNSPKYKQILIA
jgi:hypothetical protein